MLEMEVETASIRSRGLKGRRDAFGLFPRKAALIGDSREDGDDRRSLREEEQSEGELRVVIKDLLHSSG